MKHKIIFTVLIACGGAVYSQSNVGIGTSSPNAVLDVITRSTSAANNSLRVLNSDGTLIMSGRENGDVGIGPTTFMTDSQFEIFGPNNGGSGSTPSFNVAYPSSPQRWGIYINPKQGSFNPAYPGYFSFYFDNDGQPSTYYTASTGYGTFFGMHGAGTESGIFFAENGSTFIGAKRVDADAFASQYLTTYRAAGFSGGSIRIADEAKGYVVGGTCPNAGTIAFDSANNNFIGCGAVLDGSGNPTSTNVWKKLNNN